MNRSQLEEIKVFAGQGQNDFTMSRGSFKYNQTITSKEELVLTDKKTDGDKTELVFSSKAKENYIFVVEEKAGRLVLSTKEAPASTNRYWVTVATNPSEHIYGCGETYSEFDLKGQNVRIWVAEHQNAGRISKKMVREKFTGKKPERVLSFDKYESYYAQPTFVSSDKYYVHCDINNYSEFDFSKSDVITFYFQEKPSIISESAESFEELSYKLSNLLGRQRRLPDWLYDGGIIAVQEGPDRIDEKIKEAEAAGVKINGVWSQDWSGCRRTGFGYQVMWNWHVDDELYPNLEQKIKEWDAKGIKFLGYINPFLAIEKDVYAEAASKGYCVKDKEGKDYLVTITTFPAAMIDFTNPDAYNWYKELIKKNMIGIGMGGWMADFGEYLPVDSVLFSGEDPASIHNTWPAIWAKMNREAIEECGKENEVFFFTRAGHTGTVENSAMMWTGDHHVDWSMDDGIGAVIPATLSLAMSGYGITHSDVGGYTTVKIKAGNMTLMSMTREKELLLRWEELNVFSPLFRSHEGNQPVNNAQVYDDKELFDQLERCTKMHVALKPYLKEQVDACADKGTPVMRPLFYYYDEPKAYTDKTEYLLGRDILVCPVIKKGANSRKCYLPNDEWVHLFSEKEYKGGEIEVDAPIGQPPVFIRKSSKDFDQLLKIKNI